MTGKEVVQKLHEDYLHRSFCLHQQDWFHRTTDGGGYYDTTYDLSVLPGFDGSKCQQFRVTSPEACFEAVDRYVRAHDSFADVQSTDTVAVRIAN